MCSIDALNVTILFVFWIEAWERAKHCVQLLVKFSMCGGQVVYVQILFINLYNVKFDIWHNHLNERITD